MVQRQQIAGQCDGLRRSGGHHGEPPAHLWHSFENEAPGDPRDWLFQVRQYGMHTYLFFLTEVAGVDRPHHQWFYSMTRLTPQQYHYEAIGGDLLRSHFADWAAQNTADPAYLSREQVEARLEVEFVETRIISIHMWSLLRTRAPTDGSPHRRSLRRLGYNVLRINHSGSLDTRCSSRASREAARALLRT